MPWQIKFYEDDDGHQPVRAWLGSLTSPKRAAAIAAIKHILGEMGPDICRSEAGKNLGDGLIELRIRQSEAQILRKTGGEVTDQTFSKADGDVLLRVFCHVYGNRIVLLLGAYDKGADPSTKRQNREISEASRRLRAFKLAEKRKEKGRERR